MFLLPLPSPNHERSDFDKRLDFRLKTVTSLKRKMIHESANLLYCIPILYLFMSIDF